MNEWLRGALSGSDASDEDFVGYVLGRGLPHRYMEDMGVCQWVPPSDSAPDETFRYRHGAYGERRKGWLAYPIYAPRGHVVGITFRRWEGEKEIRDHRLPETKWIPTFGGLTPRTLERIWAGADVWLVEGLFDMAIGHVIPERDVVLECGTARLSNLQIKFLRRYLTPRSTVHVAYDEDETGRKQVEGYKHPETGRWVPGVLDRLRRVGCNARDVRYRGAKDPGEIWEDGGARLLRHRIIEGR